MGRLNETLYQAAMEGHHAVYILSDDVNRVLVMSRTLARQAARQASFLLPRLRSAANLPFDPPLLSDVLVAVLADRFYGDRHSTLSWHIRHARLCLKINVENMPMFKFLRPQARGREREHEVELRR